jgi:hypothetical protein
LDEVTVDCDVSADYYRATLEWQGEITADTIFKVRGEEAAADAVSVEASALHPAFIEVLQASDRVGPKNLLGDAAFAPTLTFPTGSVTIV